MRDPQVPEGRDTPAPIAIGRLKRRADFLHVGKGRRWHLDAMTVQTAPARQDENAADAGQPHIGYTLTRKVGGAVVRNRVRRRLKEAVRLSPDLPVRRGHDYVIVGRICALRLPFDTLKAELARAIGVVHEAGRRGGPKRKDSRSSRQENGPSSPGPMRTKPAP